MAWVYAHRGASTEFPENTVAAFARAVELGVDALEMDVHLTRDGEVVVAHDDTGTRMCGVAEPIAAVSWTELRRWDAGHGFRDAAGHFSQRGKAHSIPLFGDVLDAFPSTRLNVDVKSLAPDLVTKVLSLIRERNATSRVCLTSFHFRTVTRIRRAGYDGLIGLSRWEALAALSAPRGVARRGLGVRRAAQIPLHVGPLRLDRERVVERLHALGHRVDFWTVNDPDTAARLVSLGADGVMSDDPARILASVRAATSRP